jgi:putative ABC transport system permease protein
MITAASVTLAFFFVVILESFNRGVSDYLLDNEISLYTAHLEVSGTGYNQYRKLDKALADLDELMLVLSNTQGIQSVTARVEMLVLASFGDRSRPGLLWGIDQNKEKLWDGFIDKNDAVDPHMASIFPGKGMAGFLHVNRGDSLVLLGQSFYGRMAADILPFGGYLDIPVPVVRDHVIIAPLEKVREFADLPNGATVVMINLDDKRMTDKVRDLLAEKLNPDVYEIRTWEEVLSGRLSTYRMRTAATNIFKIILYLIVGFGILGTVLLTCNERKREHGLLMAFGMKKNKLIRMILMELFVIACFGILAGLALVYPIIHFFYYRPIRLSGELADIMSQFNVDPVLMMSLQTDIFLSNAIFVLMITMFVTLLALVMVWRLKIAKAIHG